jgi:DNA adenine methylase
MKISDLAISLKSGDHYKRYKNPYLRYAGGKSLAVGHIISHIPDDTKTIVSPFFGGGSLEIALALECDVSIKAFDIYEPLVLFWDNLINNNQAFTDELAKLKANKRTYEKIRLLVDDINKYLDISNLEKAVYFYYNHNLSYGPGFPGWPSSVYLNQKKWKSKIKFLKENPLKNISVRQKSFEDAIDINSTEFMYLDPPYFLAGKMFRGIYPSRNRPFNHNGFDHNLLCDILKKYKGKWVLSYNDCDEVKKMYKGYNFYYPEWQYTMGQGETRIGTNRKNINADHIKKSHEILITNF